MAVFEFIEGWYNPRRRHSMQHERAVTHKPARSVAYQAPRAQPVDNRL